MNRKAYRVALIFLAATALYGAAMWSVLLTSVYRVTHQAGRGMIEGLCGDDVEPCKEGFLYSLGDVGRPIALLNILGPRIWLFLGAAVIAIVLWRKSRIPAGSRFAWVAALIISLLPLLVGLALVPRDIVRSFQALAEVGLSSPSAVGSGTGEAFVLAEVGAGISLALFVAAAVGILRGRRTASTRSSESDC